MKLKDSNPILPSHSPIYISRASLSRYYGLLSAAISLSSSQYTLPSLPPYHPTLSFYFTIIVLRHTQMFFSIQPSNMLNWHFAFLYDCFCRTVQIFKHKWYDECWTTEIDVIIISITVGVLKHRAAWLWQKSCFLKEQSVFKVINPVSLPSRAVKAKQKKSSCVTIILLSL